MPPKKRSVAAKRPVPAPEEHKVKQNKTQAQPQDRKEELVIASLKDFASFPHPVSVLPHCKEVLPHFVKMEVLRSCLWRWLSGTDAYDFSIVDFVMKCNDAVILYDLISFDLPPLDTVNWTRLVDLVCVWRQMGTNVSSLLFQLKTYFRILQPTKCEHAEFADMTVDDVVFVANNKPADFPHYAELCASYLRLKVEIYEMVPVCSNLERKIGEAKFVNLMFVAGKPEDDPRIASHKDVYVPTAPKSPVY